MNIFPCKLICKYKNPPYREIVLSPYIINFESAIKQSSKFIGENPGYSIHRFSIYLISGNNRTVAKYIYDKNGGNFEEIEDDFGTTPRN